uniref:tRNA pseudouridine(55) synthase TruB n=1 Tax=Candidatus Cryptobacteroides bacterium TaxID=3085639 RepID=UPI0040275990
MPQDKPLEIKALIADKQFLSGNSRLSESIEDYPEGIIIPIDKPYRWTSADVIRKVKWAACRHFHKKNLKVGHAGTLDPLATGVLLVCIGKATKLAETLQKEGKEYLAGVSFGATTPSYDLEKAIDQEYPVEGVTEESVREVLPRFLGEQEQIAPLFSAKSVDGVRAYELARKQYREAHKEKTDVMTDFDHAVAETLNKQIINISGMELISFFPNGKESGPELSDEGLRPNPRINVVDTSALHLPLAMIRIKCSKGTYIRALARDLGEALGSGAHLNSLERTESGGFTVGNCLSVNEVISVL